VSIDFCDESCIRLLLQRHLSHKLKVSDALMIVRLSTGWKAKSLFTRKAGENYMKMNEIHSNDAFIFAIVPDTQTDHRFRVSVPSYQISLLYNDHLGAMRMRVFSGRIAKARSLQDSIRHIQFDALLVTVIRDALHAGRTHRYEEIIPTILYHARSVVCLFSNDVESAASCLACETDIKSRIRLLLRCLLALSHDNVLYHGIISKPLYSNINSFCRFNANFIKDTLIGNLYDVSNCVSNNTIFVSTLECLPLTVASLKSDGVFLLTLSGNKGFLWIGANVPSIWCIEQFGLPSASDASVKLIESILLRERNLSPLSELLRSLGVLLLRVVLQGSSQEWQFFNNLVDDDQEYSINDIVSVAHNGCRVKYQDLG